MDERSQQEILHNIDMYRLLYFFEVVNYLKSLEANKSQGFESLKEVPLITYDHYKFVVDNLMLPDDLLKEELN